MAVAAVTVYSLVVTYLIIKFVNVLIKVRVPDREEIMGLDLTQHHEHAYTLLE